MSEELIKSFNCIKLCNDLFDYIIELGSGGFGKVYKVKNKSDNKEYALKKIDCNSSHQLNEVEIKREVELLSQCHPDYVVQYFGSWIEENLSPNDKYLYIQMELCSENLQKIIDEKPKFFRRGPNDIMSCVEYFISSELFKELLECVNYIHSLNPPIMHRDIKPLNVLVINPPKNGRFLKLCDFGLAKFDSTNTILLSHTAKVGGTTKYMAPEINETTKYNIKADVYSLGVIASDIFDFNIQELTKSITEILRNKWINLNNIIISMKSPRHINRPTCSQILAINQWMVTNDEIKSYGIENSIIVANDGNKFFEDFFNTKRAMRRIFSGPNLFITGAKVKFSIVSQFFSNKNMNAILINLSKPNEIRLIPNTVFNKLDIALELYEFDGYVLGKTITQSNIFFEAISPTSWKLEYKIVLKPGTYILVCIGFAHWRLNENDKHFDEFSFQLQSSEQININELCITKQALKEMIIALTIAHQCKEPISDNVCGYYYHYKFWGVFFEIITKNKDNEIEYTNRWSEWRNTCNHKQLIAIARKHIPINNNTIVDQNKIAIFVSKTNLNYFEDQLLDSWEKLDF